MRPSFLLRVLATGCVTGFSASQASARPARAARADRPPVRTMAVAQKDVGTATCGCIASPTNPCPIPGGDESGGKAPLALPWDTSPIARGASLFGDDGPVVAASSSPDVRPAPTASTSSPTSMPLAETTRPSSGPAGSEAAQARATPAVPAGRLAHARNVRIAQDDIPAPTARAVP